MNKKATTIFTILGTIIFLFLGITLVNAQADIDWQMECPSGHWDVNNNVITCYLEEIPPTLTSTPTLTPTITLTPTPTSIPGLVDPYPEAPKCANHDPDEWHGLWNYELGCHYSHTHNDDPSSGDILFGTWPLTNTISYPWQTYHDGVPENVAKHKGYKFSITDKNQLCYQEGYQYLINQGVTVNCVDGWRLEYHAYGGVPGAVTRFHSYYLQAKVCTPDFSECGTISTGGHADFGILEVPYKQYIVRLPTDDPELFDQTLTQRPYRGHRPPGQLPFYTWNSDPRYGYNLIAAYDFRALDDWQNIDADNPYSISLICPAYDCIYNHSSEHIYNIEIRIDESWDDDGDGFVTYSGFTDVRGNIDTSCTQISDVCVPLEINNVPVGLGVWSLALSGPMPPQEMPMPDYDIYFNGEVSGWIEY